jgi:hypothetical protein
MADLMDEGLCPVAGGTLDQAAVFLEARRFIASERRRWREEGKRQ